MHNHFHFRPAALAVMLLCSSVAVPAVGYCKGAKATASSEKTAIRSALKRELSHATPDHIQVSSFSVTSIDVRSNWALADVKPAERLGIDPVSVLLHKVGGRWKVVTLGSNLMGSGKQYGVPRSLWKRWHLGL